MAHILVYAQRTPHGIHPASAAALCVARDIGSERGATISAVCPGDGGRADQFVIGAVSRYGADLLTFLGPAGIRPLYTRLHPLIIFVPYTEEGLSVIESLGAPEVLWLQDPEVEWDRLASLTAVVSGVLPWYELPSIIDAEYDNEASLIELPEWVAKIEQHGARGPLRYFNREDLDQATRAALASLGAKPVGPEYLEQHQSGSLLWFGGPQAPLPKALESRAPGARVVLFPGEDAEPDPSWMRADWVLGGAWPEAVKQLHSELWKPVLS
ncbi:MAG TPA: hypothetical protein VIK91_02910 [Nannocystis sp.]